MLSRVVPVVIPAEPDLFDAAWLTETLQGQYDGVVVERLTRTRVIRTACTKIFLTVDYNDQGRAAGLPRHLVIKTGLEAHSLDMYKMLLVEAHCYAEMLSRTRLNRPAVFLCGVASDRNHVLIMEDLTQRDVRFLYLLRALSYAQMEGFLAMLAELHAQWWEAPEVRSDSLFDWMPEPCTGRYMKKMDLMFEDAIFEQFLEAPRGAATPVSTHDRRRLRAGMQALRALHLANPRTVCHGDTHLHNLYEDADGKPALLDWSPRKAPWFHDVCYMMTAGLDVADRRRWEQPLLAGYLRELESRGIAAPAFDEAWACYRREPLWGMFIFLTNGFAFQTEASNTAAASRFGAAMLDHDTFRRLGV